MIEALACNTEPAKFFFRREIINFEFVERIGEIDIHNNSQKREKMLLRHGKKLFKKVPSSKERINIHKIQKFGIDKNEKFEKNGLTLEEINRLLASVAEGDTEPSKGCTGKTEVFSEKEIRELLSL